MWFKSKGNPKEWTCDLRIRREIRGIHHSVNLVLHKDETSIPFYISMTGAFDGLYGTWRYLGHAPLWALFSLFFNVMDPPTTDHQWIIDKLRMDNTALSFQVQKKWWPPIKSTYNCELFVSARTFYLRDIPAHLRRAFSSFHLFFFFFFFWRLDLFIFFFFSRQDLIILIFCLVPRKSL